MDDLYRDYILEHYKRPRNFGELEPHDLEAHDHNPLCGDEMGVHVRVEERVRDRDPHIDLRGEVHDDLRPLGGEDLPKPRIADVDLVQGSAAVQRRRDVGARTALERIDHRDLVAGVEQTLDHVGSDESRTARDQDLHDEPSRYPFIERHAGYRDADRSAKR